MDNNKRTRLRSKAPPVIKSVVPTVVVPTSSKEALQQTRNNIVEVEVEGEHDRGLPVVRGVNKRKRDPRGGSRRPSHQKLESEEGSVLVFVDENATTSGEEVRKGETQLSKPDPDSTSPPQVNNKTYVNIIPEIMAEDQAVIKHLDKRRESSRLRVRPSKFREGFLLGNLKPKPEHKGAVDDSTTALEIVLPVDTQNSSVAKSSDNNPKASSSRGASESDIDSSFGGPTQTSAGNNKFKITYKLGSSKGPERRAASAVSPSTARKGVDENELKLSLAVVKRVMQIKSAEPFNEPVDPSALEIPDYFDVISEPMDLGTIRGSLEAGKKYKTALDVYADVLLVWSNCRSYNQDEDPIMDVLRIAETVFNKHWNLAGLPVLPTSSKAAKGKKEEGDEIESSDELVGTLEQGEREKAKPRKSQDAKNGSKSNFPKIVHFDTSNSRLKTKRSASVEQVMAESKAREDKLEENTLEMTNDEANLSHEDADDEGIDEEHIPEKVEDGEFHSTPEEVVDSQADGLTVEADSQADVLTVEVDSQADGQTVEVDSQADGQTVEVDSPADGPTVEPEVTPMKESEEEQAEVETPLEKEVKTPVQERDNTVRASSSNKRRTFGTVHHKQDCTCVVCVGRRRKLARQEKEGIVEGKKDRKHSRSHNPDISQESPQVGRSPRVRKPPKPPQDQEAVRVSPAVAVETQVMETDRADCQTGNFPAVEATVDDLRYFPATYELPLRKVTPAFLHFTQVLFGRQENTVWSRHHSLGCRLPPPLSKSSMFAAVHSLSLSEK